MSLGAGRPAAFKIPTIGCPDTLVSSTPTNRRLRALERLNPLIMKILLLGFVELYKPIPVHQAKNILDAKAAVDKEWYGLEQLPAWTVANVKVQKTGHRKGIVRERDGSLCDADSLMPPQETGVGAAVPDILRSCGSPRLYCEGRLWFLRCVYGAAFVSTTNDSHKSSGLLPDCPSLDVVIGYVHHVTNGQTHGKVLNNLWFFWKGICTDTALHDCYGRDRSKRS